ncbi:AfsR/SARP family transcriptional regulator [Actinoplanes aureus]|uniref:Tetratricopeptide repeat protein n=1 Tax=Actinoplanes aureus TaxID=2792083 RepID=A0A931G372_9ACTN|nr:BTAD domain-containing putative transcriptional regulator [Actinoplanes aureus]MBG0566761.1 tetratricopeptide repeat protein [Actinoplanes aureus]
MGGAQEPAVHFQVLGPLVARRADADLSLGPAQQRVILAVLLLHADRPVDRDSLLTAVWGEAAPAYAVNLLQKHISALRRILEPGRDPRSRTGLITWTDVGYQLKIGPGTLDLHTFEAALRQAHQARAERDLPAAAEALRTALSLWRGPPFAGLCSPLLDAERDRLLERRADVQEDRIHADLDLGRDADLVPELRQLVADHPLRERLHRLLMLALYRAGRQADALNAFHTARGHLREQLGVEPGPELVQLHQRILRADPALDRPAKRQAADDRSPPRPRPAQLPHDTTDFVGRTKALNQLNLLLGDEPADGRALVITSISGTAGVGKTALAVHWSHQIRGRFPDGQLYVNLRGYDPSGPPMSPGEAVRGFLDALGVPEQKIPTGLESQAGLYRSLLAERRMLVVLDNAHDAEQVRPLLPGAPGCLVVITSRSDLPGLVAAEGARPVTIDLLSVAEARALLGRRLGADRIWSEPRELDEIITLCARLPLALTVVAARAASHPQFSLSDLAVELRESASRLDVFEDGDRATDVRGVFSWSYRKLDARAARIFRYIGLQAGPEITTPATASLAGIPLDEARPALAELARAHLVTERAPGCFGMHDLLRAYATELARVHDQPSEREAALRRMLDHYIQTGYQAHQLLNPHHYDAITVPRMQPGVAPERIASNSHARSWFANHRPVLLAALRQGFEGGFTDEAWYLTCVLSPFLEYHGLWLEWQGALETAQLSDDPQRSALAHRLRGRAYIKTGRYDEADGHLHRALELYRTLGDLAGQAEAHRDLALKLDRQEEHREALAEAEQSLLLFRAAGHETGQARAENAVGWFSTMLGDHDTALVHCREALALQSEIGDRFGQAETYDSLGHIYLQLGDWTQAKVSYQRALELYHEFDDRYDEADTLVALGDTYHAAGSTDEAYVAWRKALSILDQLGQPYADRLRGNLERKLVVGVQHSP